MIGDNGLLFGWSESTWLWLDQAGILMGNVMVLLSILGLIAGLVKRESIHRWLRTNRFAHVGEQVEHLAGRYKAVLFTVSNPATPLRVMERIKPEVIGLLATEASRAAADTVAENARRQGVRVAGIWTITDPDDPAESRALAAAAIGRLQRGHCTPLAVDVTGGKAPMSIGAFMAAEEAALPSLYFSAPFDKELKRPDIDRGTVRCIAQPGKA